MADYVVRVGPLLNVESLICVLGCNPRPIYEAAGLDRADLHDVNHHIPYASAASLLETAAQVCQCDHFGLLLGHSFGVRQLGVVGRLAQHASDVGSALHDIVTNFRLHDFGGITTLDISPRYTSFGYKVIAPEAPSAQVHDLCVACICATMRAFCGLDWNPLRVELSRAQPADHEPYGNYFRAPILFGSAQNTIIFRSKWLGQSLAGSDNRYHIELAQAAQRQLNDTTCSLSWKVQAALHQRLASGDTSASVIAGTFDFHERTLHRRLRQEGTSFRKLLDEVRQTAGRQYLMDSTIPISDIARNLGYGSNNAFDHAFDRWFGVSPTAWRKLNNSMHYGVKAGR